MAEPNYAARAESAIATEIPDLEPDLVRLYALLALTRGEHTNLADVHDAWSLWCTAADPGHRSLIPFDALAPEVRELDRPYAEAIHRDARAIRRGG